MEMDIKARVCGPCYTDGVTAVAIRQIMTTQLANYLGAEPDDTVNGVISVCGKHAKNYALIMAKLRAATDDVIEALVREREAAQEDGVNEPAQDATAEEPAEATPAVSRVAATPSARTPAAASSGPAGATASVALTESQAYIAAARVWGKGNGYAVKDRGRVPGKILEAFNAAGKPGFTSQA